jgi:hypothetical protein
MPIGEEDAAIPLDGLYTPPPAEDPIVGVRTRSVMADLGAGTVTIVMEYVTKVGLIDHSETIALKSEEFAAYAAQMFPGGGFGRANVAALTAMGRLANVLPHDGEEQK